MKNVPQFCTPDTAGEMLRLAADTVRGLCQLRGDGPFPGAVKLNPNDSRSPWLIPAAEVRRELKRREKASV